MNRRTTMRFSTALLLAALGVAGCDRNDMHDGAQIKPYEASEFFTDGMSSRPLVEGTVPRVMGQTTSLEVPDLAAYASAPTYPFPITRGDLVRGQERYNIYCSVCHGATGEGDGMIVRRGFTPPPSFHLDRLRQAPPRHYYEVMTNGYGAMYSYSDRVSVEDRWRITAYIQTLQLSQNADPALLTEQERQDLTNPPPPQQHAAATDGAGHRQHDDSHASETTTETTTHE